MRYTLFILSLLPAIYLAGCSSDDSSEPGGDNYFDYDIYGVSKWDNEDNFAQLKYYTLVDTITLKTPNISVVIKSEGKVSTSVDWNIDGRGYESIRFDETAGTSDGITVTSFYPLLEDGFEYAGGMEIGAVATVDRQKITRQAMINEEARRRDVLCVDFGMSSQQVAHEIELLKGEGKFNMRDADTGIENMAPHFIYAQPGRTLYLFEHDELMKVVEFPYSIFDDTGEVREDFLDFCKRVGMPWESIPLQNGLLVGNPTWDREGICFTLQMRSDVLPDPEGDGETEFLSNSIGISYEII
ncbi:MAG: hypothetical protein LUE10_00420 [Alistipes sp.]|nr:hypothetical protein [Alistipes sp.]